MPINIPLPNINAPTEAARLEQVRSYLYKVAEQLNWAFNTVESNIASLPKESAPSTSAPKTPEEVQSNFNSIKSLIIKSADIVDEYYEKISKRLEGLYVASGEFGEYKEKTSATFEATSKGITQLFEDAQTISQSLEDIREQYIDSNAYIKSGILYYDAVTGAAVYGLEIGQTITSDGNEVFDKFARFTSDRLSFYDSNNSEVAYISDYKLFITNAEITGILTHGGYDVDPTDGLAYIWRGRS